MMLYENSHVQPNQPPSCFIADETLGDSSYGDDFFGEDLLIEPTTHVYFSKTLQSNTMLSLDCAENACNNLYPGKPSEQMLGDVPEVKVQGQAVGQSTNSRTIAKRKHEQVQEYSQQRREKAQLLKRRRSLDDEQQLKQVKREKAKLTERRRSMDSSVKFSTLTKRWSENMTGIQRRTVKRSNLWTFEEEVFLVAAVMECFLRRGSLTSNKGRDGCWKDIKSYFDMFLRNYNKKQNKQKNPGATRAASALYRHFKTLKERISKDPSKDLRQYYSKFQNDFNKNDCLLNLENA